MCNDHLLIFFYVILTSVYFDIEFCIFFNERKRSSDTYYLRKLSHNIIGIVNHTLSKNTVYVADERACGAKNADLTISLIDQYVEQNLPSWARHLCLFMDNGATNKNQFILHWSMELGKSRDGEK